MTGALSVPTLAVYLLKHRNADQIAAALETMLAVLDYLDGDPDAEDNGDGEPTGDERDGSFPEWHSLRAAQRRHEPTGSMIHEDDEQDDIAEDDDPPEDGDPAGQCDEDGRNTSVPGYHSALRPGSEPGCPIADPAEMQYLPAVMS